MGLSVLRVVAGICYPFVVYAGLTNAGPRVLAVTLGVALALQSALAGVFDQGQFFLFVPTLVNATLWVGFARTLPADVSMVETFARLRGRELPAEEIVYRRRNTLVWCVFFALNGGTSLWFALYGSLQWWTYYTGRLSYLLVGILFGTESVYRYWRFRPYDGSLADPLFRKIFPPREAR